MWPNSSSGKNRSDLRPVRTYRSEFLADQLGVGAVYIRDEGMNTTGSMKDYLVTHGVLCGKAEGFNSFTAVSSGNHAFSLASHTAMSGDSAIVFTPASSSKIPMLCGLPRTFVIGIRGAIFEDVYSRFSRPMFDDLYNMNVSNENLISGFDVIASDLEQLNPRPSHILAGVGNGSYLAGIIHGMEVAGLTLPKIVPVGMSGAFPTQSAFEKEKLVDELEYFGTQESKIDAAEGSIAIASYSMPQLMYALRLSGGFPLGGLTNNDIVRAYQILAEDRQLLEYGVIPEPTGIMGLAAAIAHKDTFGKNDTLLISFTGSGIKDREGIQALAPEIAGSLIESVEISHAHIVISTASTHETNNLLIAEKDEPIDNIKKAISLWREFF